MNSFSPANLLTGAFALMAPLGVLASLTLPAHGSALPTRSCAYDPSSGKANPLAGKAFISINEIEGDTIFTYQILPSQKNRGTTRTVVAQQRELTLENTSLEKARQLLVSAPDYYTDLLGYESSSGFGAVDQSLTCWSNSVGGASDAAPRAQGFSTAPSTSSGEQPVLADPRPAVFKPGPSASASTSAPASGQKPLVQTQASTEPAPAEGTTPSAPAEAPTAAQAPATTVAARKPSRTNTIAKLADGEYRFWNGKSSSPNVSDDTLLTEGGVLFIFRKQGNKITGNFAYIDGEDSACVFGFVNNDTVSGFAYPYSNEVKDAQESFINLGPADFLKVRRASKSGSVNFYRSALLDLQDFNPINLGPVLPPSKCQA